MGKTVDDEDYTDTLLASLSALYNYAISSISASTHLKSEKLTAEIFKQFIIDEYDCRRLANKESDSKDKVLTTDASKKSQSKDKDKRKPVECFNCHKLGHCRSKCWAKGRGNEGGGPKKFKESKDSMSKAKEKKDKLEVWAAMVLPGEPAVVAAAAGKPHAQAECGTMTKLYDSKASQHMSPFRDRFIKYTEIVLHPIQAADKRVFYVIGLGDLKIEVPNGMSPTSIILKNVFHAPNMGLTIVSINRIAKAGYIVKFKDEFCVIQDKAGDRVGLIPANQNGLYKVKSVYTATPPEEWADLATLH